MEGLSVILLEVRWWNFRVYSFSCIAPACHQNVYVSQPTALLFRHLYERTGIFRQLAFRYAEATKDFDIRLSHLASGRQMRAENSSRQSSHWSTEAPWMSLTPLRSPWKCGRDHQHVVLHPLDRCTYLTPRQRNDHWPHEIKKERCLISSSFDYLFEAKGQGYGSSTHILTIKTWHLLRCEWR